MVPYEMTGELLSVAQELPREDVVEAEQVKIKEMLNSTYCIVCGAHPGDRKE